MVNAFRIVTQVALVGSQILGRAFIEAYKQAAAANAARAVGGATGKEANNALTKTTGMTLDEANQILNVNKDASVEDIVKRFEHLFKANDSTSGGSFYLQSKVVRAKERLELELAKMAREKENGEPAVAEEEKRV